MQIALIIFREQPSILDLGQKINVNIDLQQLYDELNTIHKKLHERKLLWKSVVKEFSRTSFVFFCKVL